MLKSTCSSWLLWNGLLNALRHAWLCSTCKGQLILEISCKAKQQALSFIALFMLVQQVAYSPSVDVRPEWNMAEQIAFASFSKLHFSVGEPTDVTFCGQLQYYDKLFDRVTPKATRPVQRTRRVFRSVTTSDDPVIRSCCFLAFCCSCFWRQA